MIEGATSGRSQKPSEPIDISAPDMLSVLAGQVSMLRGLTTGLEEALSSSLCSCSPLTEEAFVTFQRIDYLRQSLKDIEGLLQTFAPNFDWRDTSVITYEALAKCVDMGDSIEGFLETAGVPILRDKPAQPETKEESGDLDLW